MSKYLVQSFVFIIVYSTINYLTNKFWGENKRTKKEILINSLFAGSLYFLNLVLFKIISGK